MHTLVQAVAALKPLLADPGHQLLDHIGQAQTAGTVDDQAHGTFGVVLDQVGHGLGKMRIGHVRHGNQEVVLEVGRGAVFHGR